jgi:iron complex outermembrane recepter protein
LSNRHHTPRLRAAIPGGMLLGVLTCTPHAAQAQQSPQQLPTVTVTANGQVENEQSVPMAVSVVSAAAATASGITDPQSLAQSVPGLLFNRSANVSSPFLRGVGSPVVEAGDEPPVALYVDDVYMPSAAGELASFSSLDHIEVEKGPQGTLFGRNATGGIVQIYTRDPSNTPAAEVTAGYANYDTKSGSIYATGPLTDTLSANLALDGSQQSDGWGRDDLTGAEAFTGWEYGGRAKLLWTPTTATDVLLNVDYDNLRTEEGLDLRAFPGTGSLDPLPPIPNGGFPPPVGYYDNDQNFDSHSITRQSGASLRIASDLGWARLVSISSTRFTKAVDPFDEDAGPLPIVNSIITTTEHTQTQELRLESSSTHRSWVVGTFYYHDIAGYTPLYLQGLAFLPLAYADAIGVETTGSWSAFAQARQEVLPATDLTVGVRYTADRRRLDAGAIFAGGPEVSAPNSPQSITWSKVTDRIVLDHHLTDDVMAYLGYNRGFKAGLFNPIVLPGAPIGAPVKPEVLDAYTLGVKSDLLRHMMRANVEGFYYDYRNMQLNEIVAGSTIITNAAAAIIKGIDLDLTVMPVARLTITASVEVLSGRYTSFPNGQFYVYNPIVGGNCAFTGAGSCPAPALPPNYDAATGTWNLKGDHTVQTPPLSSSLVASYEIPTALGTFDFTGGWTHTADYYADADNGLGQVAPSSPANDQQSPVNLVNTSVAWSSPDQHWTARAWVKNLTGSEYWSFAAETSFLTQFTAAPPRTFGLALTRRW